MKEKLVTVFIPSYNYAQYLPQTIESVLAQTYSNWELIIVDDCSTDDSPRIIEDYALRYPGKIRAILLDKNVGQAAASNIGLGQARGEYISLIASDDVATPNRLEEAVAYLDAHPSVAAAFSKVAYIDGQGNPVIPAIDMFNVQVTDLRSQLLEQNLLCATSCTARTQVIQALRGVNPQLGHVEDYDLWLHMLDQHDLVRLDTVWVKYRIHDRNLSSVQDFRRVSFGGVYEPVGVILQAIRRWGLDRLFSFKAPADTPEGKKERSAANLALAKHCLKLDQLYFGRPFLCIGEAYTRLLAALTLDPENQAANDAIRSVYALLGDTPRVHGEKSVPLRDWLREEFHLGDVPFALEEAGIPTEKISVIICSRDEQKFARVSEMYSALLQGTDHEIIRISDAQSLCEGYNRGIGQSGGGILVFSHDDVEILSHDFVSRLRRHFQQFDIVGVAGTSCLIGERWYQAGPPFVHGQVAHVDANTGTYTVNVYDTRGRAKGEIQALDGLFFAARRVVAEAIPFDEATFDGFHFYDLDWTYTAYRAGYRLGVCSDIPIIHHSLGGYDEKWKQYSGRFLKKYEAALPQASPRPYQPMLIHSDSKDKVLEICEQIAGVKLGLAAPVASAAETGKLEPEVEETDYARWLNKHAMTEIDAQLLAERMMLKWRVRPVMHLIMPLAQGEEALLADTLDSLGQQMYTQWRLTVVAGSPAPDPVFGSVETLRWVQYTGDTPLQEAIDHAVGELGGDWVALVEPGIRLAPQALLVAADYINLRPQWRLIYADEDSVDQAGMRGAPQFKPDFNLEMLRATYYLGSTCWVERRALLDAGGYGGFEGAENHDLALRLLDRFGAGVFGHVADVLVHRPAGHGGRFREEAGRLAVEAHLLRNELRAEVGHGYAANSYRVVYQHPETPMVTIVVPTRDKLEYFRPCVEAVLGKTAYPHYEILIVDNQSEDPDLADFVAGLESRFGGKIRTMRYDHPFNRSAIANLAVSQARGDYVLFLDNDTQIVQEQWLDRMMAHAQRTDVAVVGACLVYPETNRMQSVGQVLGLAGAAGNLFDGQLSLGDPGNPVLAQVDHDCSAVAGACMLVRKSVFQELGGMDEGACRLYFNEVDFCLRVAERGYRIVWTPYTVVVHHGSATLKQALAMPLKGAELAAAREEGRAALLERWLPRLARDPAYNRQLSLAVSDARVESDVVVNWDVSFHDRPRILGVPLSGGSGAYRVIAPLGALSHAGLCHTTVVEARKMFETRVLNPVELARAAPDSLLLHVPVDDKQLAALRDFKRFSPGVFRLFTMDDRITDTPAKNPYSKHAHKDARFRLRKALADSDRLIVTTQPLADLCADMIGDIRIVPNRLKRAKWTGFKPLRRQGDKPRVGWAGAQQHLGDLELVFDVIRQTADEVDWIFFGMCPAEILPYVKESHGFVLDFAAYPAKLASLNLDLAVAPLESNLFNEAKSNLRLLEYGAMGWPVVCSDIYPYRDAPVKRVPNEPKAWAEAIRERIHDLDAAEQEGDALRCWVLQHYILEDHLSEWRSALLR